MKRLPNRFLTAAEYLKLSPRTFRPAEPRHKEKALEALERWTGALSRDAKLEAATMIDSAARRFLFFRFRANSIPTAAELETMLQRRLREIQEFRRSIDNLNYWESHWINHGGSLVTPSLQLDLEAAEDQLRQNLVYGSANGYWRRRGRPDARWDLLIECHDLMAHFKKGSRPGATKGDGKLVEFTRCVYYYAVGEDETDGVSFDRQIDILREINKMLDSCSPRSRLTTK